MDLFLGVFENQESIDKEHAKSVENTTSKFLGLQTKNQNQKNDNKNNQQKLIEFMDDSDECSETTD